MELYFWPMACSLASRIELLEAGIEARYHLVHLWDKRVIESGANFWDVSSKGAVPVLVLDNGEKLTENAAVLQYVADRQPDLKLAPPAGSLERYRMQEWLSFVGSEIHKGFLFPTFWYGEAANTNARERVHKSLGVAAAHLKSRSYLVGSTFTVADAYLAWSLMLLGRGGVDIGQWPALADYHARIGARPHVKAAVETELEIRKVYPPQMTASA